MNRARSALTIGVTVFAVVTAIAVLSPYCLITIVVRRLHDLDMSGWHVLTLLAGMLGCQQPLEDSSIRIRRGILFEGLHLFRRRREPDQVEIEAADEGAA